MGITYVGYQCPICNRTISNRFPTEPCGDCKAKQQASHPMTPEAIAKLARQIAESEWPIDAYGQPASQRCAARITPILTAHLAAREEEYARLRERCEAATAGVDEAATSLMESFSNARVRYEIGDKPAEVWIELRTAITAHLTTLLAERDAVLRECRDAVCARRDQRVT